MNRASLRDKLRGINQRSLFGSGAFDAAFAADAGAEGEAEAEAEAGDIPTARQARTEAVQRLQVGLLGVGAMVLLVGLASIIGGQADLADELAVPEAAPTTEPSAGPAQANPLADAGVVPDIEAEPAPPPPPAGADLSGQPAGGSGSGGSGASGSGAGGSGNGAASQ